MKITAQEEYGLRCLLRLAEVEEGQSLTITDVAAAEGLSEPYVAKLLAVMRKAGLVESERGRGGGYRIAASPAEIGLGSLLLVLGEPLFNEPEYCERYSGTETDDGRCVHTGDCSLKSLWNTLELWIRGTLDQVTLADLVQNERHITELVRARLVHGIVDPVPEMVTLNIK